MAAKTNAGNYFEDFDKGATLVHAVPRTITEGDCALYVALTGDRYPLHCSAEFARSLGYRRETVNDMLVFHMVFGKTVNDVSLNAVANLGYAGVRFLSPVYPGDTVRSTSEVIGKKENKSGKNGVVWVKTTGKNQHDGTVLEYFRWVMVNKRDPNTPTGAADKPDLPTELQPSELPVPAGLDLAAYQTWASGGSAFFEDYEKGERIDHVDGMTIEEAEHMIATRLYQNTAKVHFDNFAAKDTRFGKRLMYGGHVISIARSLSFNGLENALGILAWNGGTHANPTFAGDTLYAYSEILDKAELDSHDDCGALRVRLCAAKNVDMAKDGMPHKIERDGKQVYDPNVVLDLDYWLLMPKKR
ncbi:MAG: MaoC family dehydratase [Myxococcales bacterium]|nr:MaoC family dehydratase [Myxococcales bacterium]MDD9970169.1 MaoC family dehydratase [Myxococcales bacterium]